MAGKQRDPVLPTDAISRELARDCGKQEDMVMFALRIVNVDHYQSPPLGELDVCYSEFRSAEVKQVPVIRVFGATPSGQKTCLHLHGVFPYIYVPYDGTQPEEQYLRQFAVSLDKAINVSLAKPSSLAQHVFKVTVVRGIPFYGYHPTERHFLKIYFYNPSLVKRAVELLQNGAVMNKDFQPHEAHIPYILQSFIDYNLHGMNLLNLASVKFRRNKCGFSKIIESKNSQTLLSSRRHSSASIDSISSVSNLTYQLWNEGTISREKYLPEEVERQSTCELEVDAKVSDVLNRRELISNSGVNPGLTNIWEDERNRRRMRGETSQITPSSSQDRENVASSESEQFYKQQLLAKLADVITEEYKEEIHSSSSSIYAQAVQPLHESCSQFSQDWKDNSEPVIDEALAASLSQSFNYTATLTPSQSNILDSQDEALIRLVMGDHASKAQIGEEDSILSLRHPAPTAGFSDDEIKDDEDALEMSQQIWETNPTEEDGSNESLSSYEEVIPQVDGPIDPKPHNPGASRSTRCRLGPHGRGRKNFNNSFRAPTDVYDTPSHHYYQTVTHVSYSAGGMYQPYPPPPPSLPDPWSYRNYNLWNNNPVHGMELTPCSSVKQTPAHLNVPSSYWPSKHPAIPSGESSAMDASNPFSDILPPMYGHSSFPQEMPLQQGFSSYPPQLPYQNSALQRASAAGPVGDYANADEPSKTLQPHRTLLPTPQPLSSTGYTCVELGGDNASKNYISLQRISSAAKDYQEIWPNEGMKDSTEATQYANESTGRDDCMLQESYSSPNNGYITGNFSSSSANIAASKEKFDTAVTNANSCNLLYNAFQCEPISPAPTAVASPVSESELISMPNSESITMQCLTSATTTVSSLENWNGSWNCGTNVLTPLENNQVDESIEEKSEVICTAALSGCEMASELDLASKEDEIEEVPCEEPVADSRQISIGSLVCDIITSGEHIEEEDKCDNLDSKTEDAEQHEGYNCETEMQHESFECHCEPGLDGGNVLIQSMSPSQIPLSLATVEVETASRFMQRIPVLEKMASFVKTALHQINTDRSSTNCVSNSSPYSVASDSPLSMTSACESPFSRSSENSSPLELCQSQRGSPSSEGQHAWSNRAQLVRNLHHDQFTQEMVMKGRPAGRGRGRPPRRGNARRSPPVSTAVHGAPPVRKRGRPPNNSSLSRPFDLSKATYIHSCSEVPQVNMKLMRHVGTNVHPGELLPRKPQGYYGIKYGELKVFVPRYVRLVSLLKLGREKLSIPKLERQLANPNCGVQSAGKIIRDLKRLKQNFGSKSTSGNCTLLTDSSESSFKTKIRLLLPPLLSTSKKFMESRRWTLYPQPTQMGLKIRLRSRNSDSQNNSVSEEGRVAVETNSLADSGEINPVSNDYSDRSETENGNLVIGSNANTAVDAPQWVTERPFNASEMPCSFAEVSSESLKKLECNQPPSNTVDTSSKFAEMPPDIDKAEDEGKVPSFVTVPDVTHVPVDATKVPFDVNAVSNSNETLDVDKLSETPCVGKMTTAIKAPDVNKDSDVTQIANVSKISTVEAPGDVMNIALPNTKPTELLHAHTPPLPQSYTPPLPETYTLQVPQTTTPPIPQSQTPPLPQTCTPPLSRSYTPPLPHTFTPPLPRSYTPPVAQTYTLPPPLPPVETLLPVSLASSETTEALQIEQEAAEAKKAYDLPSLVGLHKTFPETVSESTDCKLASVPNCKKTALQKSENKCSVGVACNRSRRPKVDYNPHAFAHIWNYDQIVAGNGRGRGWGQGRGGASRRSRGRGRVKFRGCRSLRVDLTNLLIPLSLCSNGNNFDCSDIPQAAQRNCSKLSLKRHAIGSSIERKKCWQSSPPASVSKSSEPIYLDKKIAPQATSTPLQESTQSIESVSPSNGTVRKALKYELRKSPKPISDYNFVEQSSLYKNVRQLPTKKYRGPFLTRRPLSSRRKLAQHNQEFPVPPVECWSIMPDDTTFPAEIKKLKIRRSTLLTKANEKLKVNIPDNDDDDFVSHYANKSFKPLRGKRANRGIRGNKRRGKLAINFVESPLISRNVDVTELSNCASDISSVGDIVTSNENGGFDDSSESKESETSYFDSPPRLQPETDVDEEIKLRRSELPPVLLEEEEELEFDSAEERTEDIGSDDEGLDESLLLSDLSDDDIPRTSESDYVAPSSGDTSFCNSNELDIRIESVYSSSVEKFDRLSPCPSVSSDEEDKLDVETTKISVAALPVLHSLTKESDKSEIVNAGSSSKTCTADATKDEVETCDKMNTDNNELENNETEIEGKVHKVEVDEGNCSQDLFPSSFDMPPILMPLKVDSLKVGSKVVTRLPELLSKNLQRCVSEDNILWATTRAGLESDGSVSGGPKKNSCCHHRSISCNDLETFSHSEKVKNCLCKGSRGNIHKQLQQQQQKQSKFGDALKKIWLGEQQKNQPKVETSISSSSVQVDDETNENLHKICKASSPELLSPESSVQEEATLASREKMGTSVVLTVSDCGKDAIVEYDEKDLFGSDLSSDEWETDVDQNKDSKVSVDDPRSSPLIVVDDSTDVQDVPLDVCHEDKKIDPPYKCEVSSDDLTPGQRFIQHTSSSDTDVQDNIPSSCHDLDDLSPSPGSSSEHLTNTSDVQHCSLDLNSKRLHNFCSANSNKSSDSSTPDQPMQGNHCASVELKLKDNKNETSLLSVSSSATLCSLSSETCTKSEFSSLGDQNPPQLSSAIKKHSSTDSQLQPSGLSNVTDALNDCHSFIASLCSDDHSSSVAGSSNHSLYSAAASDAECDGNLSEDCAEKGLHVKNDRICPINFEGSSNCVSVSNGLSSIRNASSLSFFGITKPCETPDVLLPKCHTSQDGESELPTMKEALPEKEKESGERNSVSSLWNVESVMNLITESVNQKQNSTADANDILASPCHTDVVKSNAGCMLLDNPDGQEVKSLLNEIVQLVEKDECKTVLHNDLVPVDCVINNEIVVNLEEKNRAINNRAALSKEAISASVGQKVVNSYIDKGICTGVSCKLVNQNLPNDMDEKSSFAAQMQTNASVKESSDLESMYEDISSDSLESYITDDSNCAPAKLSHSSVSVSDDKEGGCKIRRNKVYTFIRQSPSREELLSTLNKYHIPQNRHQKAHYSRHSDDLDHAIDGKTNRLVGSSHVSGLPDAAGKFHVCGLENWRLILATQRQEGTDLSCANLVNDLRIQAHMRSGLIFGPPRSVIVTPCLPPPSLNNVDRWVKQREMASETDKKLCESSNISEEKVFSSIASLNTLIPKKQSIDLPVDVSDTQEAQAGDDNKSINVLTIHEGEFSSPLPSHHVSAASPFHTSVRNELPEHSTPAFNRTSLTFPSLSCTPILKKTPGSTIDKVCELLIKKQALEKIEEEQNCAEQSVLTSMRRKGKRLKMDRDDEPSTLKRPRRRSSEESGSQADRPNTPLYHQLLTTQLRSRHIGLRDRVSPTSQLDGPTPNNSHAFKVSYENLQDVKAMHEHQYLTTMSLELHIRTRHDLHPDPEVDPICAIFYSIHNDIPDNNSISRDVTGVIILDRESWELQNHCKRRTSKPHIFLPKEGVVSVTCPVHLNDQESSLNCPSSTCQCQAIKNHRMLLERTGVTDVDVTYVPSELSLLEEMVRLTHRWDPDILLGYEVEMLSWGYLLQRGTALQINLQSSLSRLPDVNPLVTAAVDREEMEPEVVVKGRIVLNLWRLMRTEAALTTYSLENVAYHILHQRIPSFSFRMLTKWFDHTTDLYRYRTVKHYIMRVKASMQLVEQLDLVGRTSELARLFGIQFYEVLSRGSQFRVESMMLRMAKPLNFVACSPSVEQRARMRAPECLALIMEPESKFYSDPVVVLDFQSLYPSMMIAYNYCYSTCLGKVDSLGHNEPFDFGCTSLHLSPALLKELGDQIFISPVGVAFVKPSIRKGILPRMLEEILETRIMVKKAMKEYKRDKALTRVLDARQLGLKLIANVTYGYASANFSGRMPCVEVGDSVVSKARETLERAIQLVKDTRAWEAEVVYGDTDSMFIHLPGRSKEEAFRIGQEIADAVTAINPKPVKLKFEKVYLPCVLQTKKRYVGNMYETVDQKEATFDAKGIETVRRDGCPAVVKVLEKSLRLLFSSRDVSQVKTYVQRQLHKLLIGRVSLQDYTFAREYRGLTAYKPAARVPALEIAKQIMQVDRRREPRVGERVPYVIVYGSPGEPLFQLVRQPQEVMTDENLRLNCHYYINSVILPPLDRIFKLMNVNVHQWYAKLPRPAEGCQTVTRHGTIAKYFTRLSCSVCSNPSESNICSGCRKRPQASVVALTQKISQMEKSHHHLSEICRSCTGIRDVELSCVSLDCPIFYRLAQASRDLQQVPHLKDLCTQMVEF